MSGSVGLGGGSLRLHQRVTSGALVVRDRHGGRAEPSVAGTICGFGYYKINPAVSIAPPLGAQAQGAVRPKIFGIWGGIAPARARFPSSSLKTWTMMFETGIGPSQLSTAVAVKPTLARSEVKPWVGGHSSAVSAEQVTWGGWESSSR